MATQPVPYYTPEEYFEIDRDSECGNEYIDGIIVPMVGATPWHGIIAVNVSHGFRSHLSKGNCRVFDSSVRIVLDRKRNYAYPDVSVVCGQLEYLDAKKETVTNPKLVVEVLSPNTMNYDLGEKLRHYWAIPSMTDVLLIAQDRVWIEYWFRQPGGEWRKKLIENIEDTLRVESVDCQIPVADFYAGVEFPARPDL